MHIISKGHSTRAAERAHTHPEKEPVRVPERRQLLREGQRNAHPRRRQSDVRRPHFHVHEPHFHVHEPHFHVHEPLFHVHEPRRPSRPHQDALRRNNESERSASEPRQPVADELREACGVHASAVRRGTCLGDVTPGARVTQAASVAAASGIKYPAAKRTAPPANALAGSGEASEGRTWWESEDLARGGLKRV